MSNESSPGRTGPHWSHSPAILADLLESHVRQLAKLELNLSLNDLSPNDWIVITSDILDAAKALRAPAQPPIISVKTMALSDDRTDYFVSIKVGDREITPYVFRDAQFKAEYEAASFRWLLLGDAKPDLMAYSEDGWPDNAEAGPSLPSTDREGK